MMSIWLDFWREKISNVCPALVDCFPNIRISASGEREEDAAFVVVVGGRFPLAAYHDDGAHAARGTRQEPRRREVKYCCATPGNVVQLDLIQKYYI